MRRETSTRWYIGAWVGWVAAMLGFSTAYRNMPISHPWWQDANLTAIATIAEMSMIVMFVAWVGALVRLARLRRWNWFVAVLVTQLLWAGIAGMVAYAGSGPEEGDAGLSRRQLT